MTAPSTDSEDRVMCAGCRQPGRRQDCERFVYHDKVGLIYDMRGGAPGEAIFVHPMADCVSAAAWAGFARLLGRPLDGLDAEQLIDDVHQGIRRRLSERLQETVRLEAPAFGVGAVRSGVEDGDVELVVIAADRHSRRVDKLREYCASRDVAVFDALSGEELGHLFGRDVVAAVAFPPGERCRRIGRDLEKLLCIEFESDA